MIHKAIGSCAPVLDNLPFRQVWAADFEFAAAPGERPEPVCMARELRSGQLVRLWATELASRRPYPLTSDSLFVAFFASAELGCHLSLDWPMPARILDLFVEFRLMTNGRATPAGLSLLGALAAFGLDSMGADEKGEMRRLILRGGPWSEGERTAILDYCQSDVMHSCVFCQRCCRTF